MKKWVLAVLSLTFVVCTCAAAPGYASLESDRLMVSGNSSSASSSGALEATGSPEGGTAGSISEAEAGDDAAGSTKLPLLAKNGSDVKRYTVLVLDTCGSASFYWDGSLIYTADSAISYVKTAALKFENSLLHAQGTNYLAIVSYNSSASVVSEFSRSSKTLKSAINGLSSWGDTRNMSAGLDAAYRLLSAVPDGDNVVKNVILCSTGMVNQGPYTYSGRYNSSTIGSSWYRTNTGVKLYAYANGAYNTATNLKKIANVYSMGIFQSMTGMPSKGKDIAEFFKKTAEDMATSPDYFYNVEDVNDIAFTFGEIADSLVDTDGDGLYDSWERNGVDIDGDGVIDLHLERMGANPNVPDVFVEVDWMVRPSKNFLWWQTQSELSYKPTENSLRLVYKAFKKHGINLHIDAGPDSKDFVTGKKWGSLSRGNQVPYEKVFDLDDDFKHWNEVAESNFATNRHSVFRHCLCMNKFRLDGGTGTSGIANGIPGQYFIVANMQEVQDRGDTAIGGTFMHELGHTLGLSHGGFDNSGANDHRQYSPAYLSVMNYLFQFPGLGGTGALDYSSYSLPSLNENALKESAGIDPKRVTAGTGLTTQFYRNGSKQAANLNGASVDYNGNGKVDSASLKLDINNDGEYTRLYGNRDWGRFVYQGGNIGATSQTINIKGAWESAVKTAKKNEELTIAEAVKNKVYGNKGDGALEFVGPLTLVAGAKGQKIVVQVKNLGPSDCDYELQVGKCALTSQGKKRVSVSGSTKSVTSVEVPIKIKTVSKAGNFAIPIKLYYGGKLKASIAANVKVRVATGNNLDKLSDALKTNKTGLPRSVAKAYSSTLKKNSKKISLPVANKKLKYTGKKITGVEPSSKYSIEGNTAKSAGTYYATVTPKVGYCWGDGTYSSKVVKWTIAKAKQSKVAKNGKIKKKIRGCKNGKLAKNKLFKLKVRGVKGKAKVTFKLKSAKKLKGKMKLSKTGKLTLHKGVKEGRYKVKVTAKVAPTKNYKAKIIKRTIVLVIR